MNPPDPDESLIDPYSTLDLLDRIKGGDETARDDLFRRFSPALERLIHGRLPAAARGVLDTQDATQEICVKVFRSLERFEHRGVGSFWGYLRQVTLNYLRDLPRTPRKLKQDGSLPEETWKQPASADLPPEISMLRREELDAFEKALEVLGDKHRSALLMRLELDLDYKFIARECDFPSPDAARMAITRALQQVCTEMTGDQES